MFESLDNHRDFYDGERIGINPTAKVQLSEGMLSICPTSIWIISVLSIVEFLPAQMDVR